MEIFDEEQSFGNLKEEDIYIFGHKNPDSDSVCSAAAYAEFKRQMGFKNVYAYKLGEINKETEFIFNYFGVDVPETLADVRPKLSDLELYHPDSLTEDEPLKNAWHALTGEGTGSRILPVTGNNGEIKGILSISDITGIFMEVADVDVISQYEILTKNLIKILNGHIYSGEYKYDTICGSVYIGTNIADESKVSDKDIIVTGKIEDAMRFAYVVKCGMIILTNGISPLGLEHSHAAVLSVPFSMFKTVSLLNHAISVGTVMKKNNITSFSEDSYVDEAADIMKISAHRNFPVICRDGKFLGVVSRRHLIGKKGKNVILVDHNERSQSAEGLSSANIIEIIDHHRVADIQTDTPLYIRSEPVGSTATIIKKIYTENNINVEKKFAGIMLGAILSDTLMFNSPTCTIEDRNAAKYLADLAEVDIEKFGEEMFAVSASVGHYAAAEILALDRKKFTFDKYTAYISQINTLDFNSIYDRQDDLLNQMNSFVKETGCDVVILMVTDIVAAGSEILAAGKSKELLFAAFGMKPEDRSIFLPGVVSRKKQIVPRLFKATQIM